jgi:hypothetical protein
MNATKSAVPTFSINAGDTVQSAMSRLMSFAARTDVTAAQKTEAEAIFAEYVAAQQLAAVNAAKAAAPRVAGVVSVKESGTTPGVICVYGLQRRPVSLYAGQWVRITNEVLAKIHEKAEECRKAGRGFKQVS